MQRLIGILVLCSMPLVSSCSEVSDGPFGGSVVEEGSRKPIEGATVVVKWYAAMSGPNGSWHPCYHVEVATTGKDGRFNVPKWTVSDSAPGAPPLLKDLNIFNTSLIDKPVRTYVYMPGYLGVQNDWRKVEKATVLVNAFKGTESERVEMLYQLDGKLEDCIGMSRVMPLRMRIYQEAKENVRTAQDAKRTEALLVGIESFEYGHSKALDRSTERGLKGIKEQEEGGK